MTIRRNRPKTVRVMKQKKNSILLMKMKRRAGKAVTSTKRTARKVATRTNRTARKAATARNRAVLKMATTMKRTKKMLMTHSRSRNGFLPRKR